MLNEWRAISARIHGLRDAGLLYASLFGKIPDGMGGYKDLVKQCIAVFGEIREFHGAFKTGLPDRAGTALSVFLTSRASVFIDDKGAAADTTLSRLIAVLPMLVALDAEVTHLLSDVQAVIQKRSERAFAHLQRSIAADPDIRGKWERAHKDGETACERLGAAHLLSHGIWAFKAHAARGWTDLILGESNEDLHEIERAAEGLVLTEWKRAKKSGDVAAMFDEARAQAAEYAGSAMLGIELKNYRYLVVVSGEPVRGFGDIVAGTITYRCINIAIDVPTPSVTARAKAKR